MRILMAFILQLVLSASANACDCFSSEQRLKASEDALAKARLAVVGRVLEVSASGIAKVLVLESFKGPAQGAVIEARQDFGLCTGPSKVSRQAKRPSSCRSAPPPPLATNF